MLGLGLIQKAGQRILGGLNALINILTGRATYSENTADSNTVVEAIDTAGILDNTTILLTPTAYSDARVHSVKTYTGELVTNGSFATDSDWTKGTGITIGGGAATFTSTPSGQSVGQNAVASSLPNGAYAKVTFEVLSITEGSFGLYFSGTLVGSRSSVGVFTAYFTKGTETSFYIRALGTTSGTISNVSVVDVSSDFDFDRASSATRINSSGLVQDIVSDLARINYDGNGANGHILLEPTSTNLLTYSQEFDHVSGYWNKSNTVIETTAITSPNNSSNTYKLFANTNTTGHFTDYDGYTGALVGERYTFTLFVKSAGSDYIQIAASSGFPSVYQNFNLSTGALASGNISSATIEAYPDNWYRISVTETTTGTSRRFLIVPALTDMARNATFTGTVQEDGVYIYGAQLEKLSYPTSYIPTSGSATTRAAETLTGSGNSTLINSTEGVLYAEIAALNDSLLTRVIQLSDGTQNNRIFLGYWSGSNEIRALLQVGGATQFFSGNSSYNTLNYNKIAFKWKVNDFALWINGVEVVTDTVGTTFSVNTLNTLGFESLGSSHFYGKCKALAVFDRALTDQQLTDLTS